MITWAAKAGHLHEAATPYEKNLPLGLHGLASWNWRLATLVKLVRHAVQRRWHSVVAK